MKLGEILPENSTEKNEIGEREITSICVKSEKCASGSMFFCFDAKTHSCETYAFDALSRGATVLVSERPINDIIDKFCADFGVNVKPYNLVVKNARTFLTKACKAFYNDPQKKLRTIAVVGTNGKTSVCSMIKRILTDFGENCGFIGTFGAIYANKRIETKMTTPDAPELYEILDDMVKSGVKIAAMELSAHAIYFKKADFTFDIAVFTNCGRDHLDFFETFENYRATKVSAFSMRGARLAVVNGDDPCLPLIAAKRDRGLITYGIDKPCDVFAMDIVCKKDGTEFIINLFDAVYRVNCQAIGRFNVYNMLAAATVCALCGVKTDAVAKSLRSFLPVSGRLERVCLKKRVYIDYAHTPEGLENALKSLNEIKGDGKLICVFGCGGNRDKEKRPVMGEISGKYADFTVITSDNPRYEEPGEIISQIEKGIRNVSLGYIIIRDREQAIKYAIDEAGDGDVVLIAGKGAEEYQEIMGVFRRFSDKEIACACIDGENFDN